MYLYLKHGLPDVYAKWSHLVPLHQVRRSISTQTPQKQGFIMNLASSWRDRLARNKEEKGDLIEVMDVLVSSNRFLRILDPNGQDLLASPSYFEKLKTQELIQRQQDIDPDEVYDLSGDLKPHEYDTRDPSFKQMHLLRFETQRSLSDPDSDQQLNVMKLTDIDFYLSGNRHLLK